MRVSRCDHCGVETELPRYNEAADGWIALTREFEDAPDQSWHFCSRECTWAYLADTRLPEPATFPNED